MMTSAETLFTQLRGIVGNANFAHLFGLKEFGRLNQQFNRSYHLLSLEASEGAYQLT